MNNDTIFSTFSAAWAALILSDDHQLQDSVDALEEKTCLRQPQAHQR